MAEVIEVRCRVRAIRRALDVLLAFSSSSSPRTNAELATVTGLDPSTVHRIMVCLRATEFVIYDSDRKRYELGPSVLRLHETWERTHDLRSIALPAMENLQADTNETVGLSVQSGSFRVYIYEVESSQAVHSTFKVGSLAPLHAGAPGKVFLAFGDETTRERVLTQPLPALGPRTKTDPAALRDDVRTIAASGIAKSVEERAPDAAAFAAPVFGSAGTLVAVLSVSLPAHRLTPSAEETITKCLRSEAARISSRLYGLPT